MRIKHIDAMQAPKGTIGDSHNAREGAVCAKKHTDWVFFCTDLTKSDQADFDLIRLCIFSHTVHGILHDVRLEEGLAPKD